MMKKLLTLSLVLTLLTGCAGKPAVLPPAASAAPAGDPSGTAVKTGLSVVTSVSGSTDAGPEGDGAARAGISLVAVTVGDDGVIDGCVIDAIQADIGFDAAGQLTADPAAALLSKNELGGTYGLKQASSIGREWNEQAAAMADYAVGKTVEELRGVAVNEKGAPMDADLAASVTISIGDFLAGIEDAVSNAEHLGAKAGDELKLVSIAGTSKSRSAGAEESGLAQVSATVAAVTFDGAAITSCCIDAAEAGVSFSAGGVITTDLSAPQPTKNEMGEGYGLKEDSSIGREWYEQAAAFSAYVTGKTAAEVASIAVDEAASPTEADLAASVTIGIGDFQALIEKAAR